jgi:subtilisin family serine protease
LTVYTYEHKLASHQDNAPDLLAFPCLRYHMSRNNLLGTIFLVLGLLLLSPYCDAQGTGKKVVTKQSDLPRFTYPVKGSASELVQADEATFNAFASRVRTDLDAIFRDYEVDDKSTMRALLSAKLDLQQIAGQYQAGLGTIEQIRALQDKPAAKLTSDIVSRAILQAVIETKSISGQGYQESFRKYALDAVNRLPWDVVQDDIKATYASARVYTQSVALAAVQTDLDPAVRKSGVLDNQQAWQLISTRNDLQSFIPIEPVLSDVLKQYIAAHHVVQPDIWAAREVTLSRDEKLTPVLIAIWDSGIDVSIFPDQVFTDPHPTASGAHGLAYDDIGAPSKAWLYPLGPEQEKAYPAFREEIKGFQDLENGIDSPEADEVQKKFRTLSADQLHELFELEKVISFYVHGTHCAGIAVRGNPAGRLVVARFNDQLPDLPFLPTEQWARQLAADFQQMSDYFKTRNVRVVNMSWGDDPQEFETWLSKTGGGADPAERKKHAAELFAIWRAAIETAIKNAPDTLFVTAAGNSNSSTGFNEDVPPSLRLPNLIVVGAVNQAGDETSFTSYGDTVVVDADGYEVESVVPGGAKVKLSGTSMASPNVVNLAAKLFALDPSLTPAQVIDLIKRGATASEDGRRHLIDEKRTVALLKEQPKK